MRDYADLGMSWRGDLWAGISVGIVALPLALAFGVSSGAGPEAGLITAIVAGVVAAIFGGSPVQVSGPTGAMVVVLAPILATQGLGALALVSVLAGVLVVAAGVARWGRLVALIPWPVIEGFTLGIAIIIFAQQVPAAVGIGASGHDANALIAAWQSVGEARGPVAWHSLAVLAGTIAIMVLWPRLTRAVPGSIVAIVATTAAVMLSGSTIATIGALPAGLPAPAWPAVDLAGVQQVIAPAATVAALAAIESLLSARVAASQQAGAALHADRELVGQGLASIASGLFGGMPATGAIARTAVNMRSGARTRMAAIVHALVLLVIVAAAGPVVSHIPMAALAGVLMVTAATMVNRRAVGAVWRSSRQDAAVFVLTALVTVSVDLIYAVGIGMAAAALLALRALSRSAGVHREELPGLPVQGDARIALLRLDGALFFGAADRVLERVARIQGVEAVVLRMSQLQLLDATGAQVLADVVAALERRGVVVIIKGVQDGHRALLGHAGVLSALSDPTHLVAHLGDAVDLARGVVAGSAAQRRVDLGEA